MNEFMSLKEAAEIFGFPSATALRRSFERGNLGVSRGILEAVNSA